MDYYFQIQNLQTKNFKNMKKIKLFAFAVLAMLSTNAFAQSATDAADDTWQYYTVMDDDGEYTLATIIGLVDSKKGTIENLEIPEQVTGAGGFKYTVIGIDVNGAKGAFQDDAKIKTVTIPANIESIGQDAFNNCYNLTTVTFASGSKLNFIDDGAFAETSSLEKLDLSNTKVISFWDDNGTPANLADDFSHTPFVSGGNLNVSLEEIVLVQLWLDLLHLRRPTLLQQESRSSVPVHSLVTRN